MPRYADDLYLGAAWPGSGVDEAAYPPSGQGVGPLGRVYIWDVVPVALNAANIAAAQTPAAAGNLVLTAGTGVTAYTSPRGEVGVKFDVPRAVQIVQAGAGTQRNYTVTGYDKYGQRMSEVIVSSVGAAVNGKKAFLSVVQIAVDGATTTAVNAGTTDILGVPFRVTDKGYFIAIHWNNTQAVDASTTVVADTTDPATTTTGDVRGTLVPSSATDGTKRLVVAIAIPAIGSGPSATRAGAIGVNQNIYNQ